MTEKEYPIGYLAPYKDHGYCFECVDCAVANDGPRGAPIYKVNIGFYSQKCPACKKLVVKGGIPVVLFHHGVEEEI